MLNFKQFISEAGQESGKLELVKTDVRKAEEYARKKMYENGLDLDKEIPNFIDNYNIAKMSASGGYTQRKDMPVIDAKDITDFQKRLEKGFIDYNKPFEKHTDPNEKFPKTLNAKTGKMWLTAGEKDGNKSDDNIPVKNKKVKVSELRPIQQQIYFDKSLDSIADNGGAADSKGFIGSKKTTFIVSSDNYIIDGHHRYLAGILIDPNIKVNCMVIDMPINDLLPASLSYSDAVGNKRNS